MVRSILVFCTILFPAIYILAQPVPVPIFNSVDSTSVTGKIAGYTPDQEEQFVNFYTYDISGRQYKFAVPIKKDGSFSFKFLQQYEGDYGLKYGVNFVKAYARPGEEIQVEVDNKEAQQPYHFTGSFKISGRSVVISGHILQFFEQYLPFISERWAAEKNLSHEEIIKRTQKNLVDALALLKEYINQNDPPEAFKNWASSYLNYEAAELITMISFSGKIKKNITDSQLIALLSPIALQTDNGWNNSSYYSFLSQISWAFFSISLSNVSYDKYQPDSSFNNNSIALDMADRYFTGRQRELIYYYTYSLNTILEQQRVLADKLWKRFDDTINNNLLQHLLESKRNIAGDQFRIYNIAKKIRDYPVDTVIKNNFLSILEKEKGRYVYIDFWGSWCGPCMAEMPHYKKFINELKDQPITFLFLAVETSEKEMMAVQKKHDISATFISINKNETNIANDVFEFSGYPAHFLLDPDGNVIAKPLFRIGPDNTRDIKALIK